jgi:arylsulfatase A-like enzyme
MCIQLSQLDQTLGKLFAVLDRTGVDYEVVLTADHGGNDLPEREVRSNGMPDGRARRCGAGGGEYGQGDRGQARASPGPTLRGGGRAISISIRS